MSQLNPDCDWPQPEPGGLPPKGAPPWRAFVFNTPRAREFAASIKKECQAFGVGVERYEMTASSLIRAQARWRQRLRPHGFAVFVFGPCTAVHDIDAYIKLAEEMALEGVTVWVTLWNKVDPKLPDAALDARQKVARVAEKASRERSDAAGASEASFMRVFAGQLSVTDFGGEYDLRAGMQNLLHLLGCTRRGDDCDFQRNAWTYSKTFQWPDKYDMVGRIAEETREARFNLERVLCAADRGIGSMWFMGSFLPGVSYDEACRSTESWERLFPSVSLPPYKGPSSNTNAHIHRAGEPSLRKLEVRNVLSQSGRLALVARTIKRYGGTFSDLRVEPNFSMRGGLGRTYQDIHIWMRVSWLPISRRVQLYRALARIYEASKRVRIKLDVFKSSLDELEFLDRSDLLSGRDRQRLKIRRKRSG